MRWQRFTGAAAAAILLAACADATDRPSDGEARPPSTAQLDAEPISAVSDAARKLFDTCSAGAGVAARQLVDVSLRDLPWDAACDALASHAMSMLEGDAAVGATTSIAHMRIEGDDGVHEEDWHFSEHDGAWQLRYVPPLLTGTWDHDGHTWFDAGLPATPPAHPDGDGDDHTTSTAAGHSEGDGHDHTATTIYGHDDVDGHDDVEPEHSR